MKKAFMRRYPPGTPLAQQGINPISEFEREIRDRQRVLLQEALEGDESAKEQLRARGLLRWWKNGKEVLAEPIGSTSRQGRSRSGARSDS